MLVEVWNDAPSHGMQDQRVAACRSSFRSGLGRFASENGDVGARRNIVPSVKSFLVYESLDMQGRVRNIHMANRKIR